jgi:polyisoprenoid-binding protein YceI
VNCSALPAANPNFSSTIRCNEYRGNASNPNEAKGADTMTTATPATTQQTAVSTWAIDPAHSVAEFKVKHMMISNVKGQFSGVSGTLERHEGDVTKSKVAVTIDAASVNTSDAQRDAHLKSADFFEVEKFPTLLFKSTRVILKNQDEHAVEGKLTIHGVTHTVRFDVEGPTPPAKDPWGNTRIGVSATTKINRKDYGLTWNTALETGGILVGEEVTITLDLQFVKS